MSWLTDLVPPASGRPPISLRSVCTELLPVILLYYGTAVLVLLPGTFKLRLALLPLTLWSAFRAITSIDIALAWNDPAFKCLDFGLGLNMMIISMRTIEWTFCHEHLRRNYPLRANGDPSLQKHSGSNTPSLRDAFRDACDLVSNFRGINWNWSHSSYIPAETRSTTSTPHFLTSTVLSAILHCAMLDITVFTVRSFSPTTFGCPDGGSIFDATLSPFSRYVRSSTITLLSGVMFYAAIQMVYDLNTINFILLFRQSPSQWPPIFNAPWAATSVSQFWGKRWHQLFRSSFINIGAKPLSILVGRVGGVLGAFFLSGIFHDWGMWAMGRGPDFKNVGGFFLMMGVGCILEALFNKTSGAKVHGWFGWLWTTVWIVGWGNFLVDAWARRGLLGGKIVPLMSDKILVAIGGFGA